MALFLSCLTCLHKSLVAAPKDALWWFTLRIAWIWKLGTHHVSSLYASLGGQSPNFRLHHHD